MIGARRGVCLPALVALLLFIGHSNVAGYDFGVVVTSETSTGGVAGGTTEIGQTVNTQAWAVVPVSDSGSFSFAGTYRFSSAGSSYVNLDELAFDFAFQAAHLGRARITAGRFTFDDATGLVLSDTADGARIGAELPAFDLSMAVGYTGLTLDQVSGVSVSRSDVFDRSDDSIWAPPRLIADARFSLVQFLDRQRLTFGLTAQVDLRDYDEVARVGDTDPATGGHVNTQYGAVVLSGPIGAGLYYDVFSVLNTGSTLTYLDGRYERSLILAALGGGSVELFIDSGLRPRVAVVALAATGDEDATAVFEGNAGGRSTGFEPISAAALGLIAAPRLQNLLAARIEGSITPFGSASASALKYTSVSLATLLLARPTGGVASLSGVLPSSDARYYGTEASLRLDTRLLSDLGLTVQAGLFFPNPDAFGYGDPRFRAALGAAISL